MKAKIRATIGGVLRLRSYVPLKAKNLKKAEGKCPNILFAYTQIADDIRKMTNTSDKIEITLVLEREIGKDMLLHEGEY